MIYLLILCFLPALLVWLFVTIFKDRLAKNPTKNEYIQMISIFALGVVGVCIAAYAISQIV